jgi:hypothetical protein
MMCPLVYLKRKCEKFAELADFGGFCGTAGRPALRRVRSTLTAQGGKDSIWIAAGKEK